MHRQDQYYTVDNRRVLPVQFTRPIIFARTQGQLAGGTMYRRTSVCASSYDDQIFPELNEPPRISLAFPAFSREHLVLRPDVSCFPAIRTIMINRVREYCEKMYPRTSLHSARAP